MSLSDSLRRFGAWLESWPDDLLTLSLLAAAGLLIYIALTEKPLGKAVVLAWIVLP